MSVCITGRVSGGRVWSADAQRPVLPGAHCVGSGVVLYVYRGGAGVFRVLTGEKWRPFYLLDPLSRLYREGLRWEALVVTTDGGEHGLTVTLAASPDSAPPGWAPVLDTAPIGGATK